MSFGEAALVDLHEIRERMPNTFISVENLRPPAGLETGIDSIDDFLLWRGVPKGDITLFHGKPGTGPTSLFLNTVRKVHEQDKWAAWVNSDWEILPSHLAKKNIKLSRLLVVEKPKEEKQLYWILQELISSSLFEVIGCHLKEGSLRNHQLQKLKKLARTHQVALVLISHARQLALNPLFSLVIECAREFFTIKRALHRPVPFTFSGGKVHADFVSELTTISRSLLR